MDTEKIITKSDNVNVTIFDKKYLFDPNRPVHQIVKHIYIHEYGLEVRYFKESMYAQKYTIIVLKKDLDLKPCRVGFGKKQITEPTNIHKSKMPRDFAEQCQELYNTNERKKQLTEKILNVFDV